MPGYDFFSHLRNQKSRIDENSKNHKISQKRYVAPKQKFPLITNLILTCYC